MALPGHRCRHVREDGRRPGDPGRMGADIVAGAPESDMCGLRGWQTREGARNAAARLIECRHDRHRPHPTIDDEVPGEVTDASLGGRGP